MLLRSKDLLMRSKRHLRPFWSAEVPHDEVETLFRGSLWIAGVAIVLVASMASSVARFAPASALAAAGAQAGGLLIALYGLIRFSRGQRLVMLMMFAVFAVALADSFKRNLGAIAVSSRANDRRCLAIQRDMLSAHPRRSDGPTIFDALGCFPQGEGSIHAPPRSPK